MATPVSAVPAIAIDGSASTGGGSSSDNASWSLGSDYASLIANGSNAFSATGAKIFNIDAGPLSIASTAQIGRVLNGVTITAAMVAQNQAFLDAIAAYCRANGISVHVEAQLSNAPQADWTYQWLLPAVAAGLPITAVENNDEVEPTVAGTSVSMSQRAAYEVAIVSQIVAYYPGVSIGQWETSVPLTETATWWDTYDAAAAAAGLPGISYLVADTPWNAPWMLSQPTWQAWQLGLSQLATSRGVGLTVLLDGTPSGTSSLQWAAQVEQHAAMLAGVPGMNVSTLLVQSWGGAYPTSVLPVNQAGTSANAAAVVAALYPLYAAGAITGQGTLLAAAPGQLVVQAGSTAPAFGIALDLGNSGAAAGGRYAIVIMSGTGLLYAQPAGAATVTGSGTTKLVLNGTVADLAAALATLAINEPFAGPDSLDIETFDADGRSTAIALPVFAAPPGVAAAGQTLTLAAASPAQGWTAATVTTNAAGVVTGETLSWHAASFDPASGSVSIARTVSIHEPLAQPGITVANGVVSNPLGNPVPGGGRSLPLVGATLIVTAFDVSTLLTQINVLDSQLVYSASSGALQSRTDSLAPLTALAAPQVVAMGNYLATGGTQVTQYNTGDNPGWSPSWSAWLGSVTTTYGSSHQVLEQVFQGGVSNPYFTLDNVFDPYTGALWEQIQSAPAPAPYGSFVTGTKYVTQFNTGDNPNWDANDWGNASQATVTWQDWKVVGVTLAPPVATGLVATAAYGPAVTGSTGAATGAASTAAAGAAPIQIAGTGGDVIYAGLGALLVNTGLGGSTVHLSAAGASQVSITSGGGDTIWTGLATAAITNTGTAVNGVHVQGGTVTLSGGATSVEAESGVTSAITAIGNGYWLSVWGNDDRVVTGDSATVLFNGTRAVVQAGAGALVNVWASGNTLFAGAGSQVWITSAGNAVTVGDFSMVDEVGAGNAAIAGAHATAFQYGTGGYVVTGTDSVVGQYAAGNTAVCGDRSSIFMAADGGVAFGNAGIALSITGQGNVATVGVGATVQVAGNGNAVTVGSGSMVFLQGSGERVGFGALAVGGAATVAGFSLAAQDVLDLSALCAGDAIRADLTNVGDYLSVAASGADAVLTVVGAGGVSAITLAGMAGIGTVRSGGGPRGGGRIGFRGDGAAVSLPPP